VVALRKREVDDAGVALAIDGLLTSADFTTAEKGWLAHRLGARVRAGRYVSKFTTALFESMTQADAGDLERLSLCFPEEVAAHRSWQAGTLCPRAHVVLGRYSWLIN
jgi:hypothetical protein